MIHRIDDQLQMEGILTVIVGVAGYFFLIDFPDREAEKKKFLTERECQFIIRRLTKDRDDVDPEPFHLKRFLAAGLDLKIWSFALLFFCNGTIAYAIAFFLPIILRQNMHFSIAASQCLVAPPYLFAVIIMGTTSWVADKWRVRGPIIALNNVISLIGVAIMVSCPAFWSLEKGSPIGQGFASSSGARYFGVFLVTAGSTANFPAVMAYQVRMLHSTHDPLLMYNLL